MLLVSAARSAVAWKRGAVAAAETYSAAVAATTSLQISSVLPLAWAGTQGRRQPRAWSSARRVPNDLSQQPTAERDPPRTRGFSGILSLELCVRLLRCCVSALISAVCSTTLSCTADPVAGADLLRCSRYKESIADPSQHCHHASAASSGHRGRPGAARPQDGS